MGSTMERHLRKMAEEFRKANPYSEEELLDFIRTCQRVGADGYASVEEEVTIIYWYFIEAICTSLRRFYPSPDAYFDRDDLVSEAVLHLFDAIRTYNTQGEVPFRCWIMRISKNAVSKFTWENQKEMRIPKYFAKKISRYLAYTSERIEETGVYPSRKETMDALSLTDGECRILEQYASIGFMAESHWSESIDLIDRDKNGEIRSVEKQAVDLYVKDALQDILKECLTPEENMFLSMSLGLNGSICYDTGTLSKLFGVTPGEILASIHAIKEKLKGNRRIQELADCFGMQ